MTPITHDECEPEVITRISNLLIKKKKKQKDLLNYLGLHRNNYTEWKKGRSTSYLHYIDKIALFLGVSPTYLLRGEAEDGLMLSQDEQRLIQMYRILHSESKEKMMDTAECLVNFEKNNKEKSSE